MPSTSLRRTMTDGLTLRAISPEGLPASESVTAALVVRSLQLLRDIDPVFGVDLYQSVGDDLSPSPPRRRSSRYSPRTFGRSWCRRRKNRSKPH